MEKATHICKLRICTFLNNFFWKILNTKKFKAFRFFNFQVNLLLLKMLSFRVFVVFNRSSWSYLYWKLRIPDVCMLSIFPAPDQALCFIITRKCRWEKEILFLETPFLRLSQKSQMIWTSTLFFFCSTQIVLATRGVSEGCQPCQPFIDHTNALQKTKNVLGRWLPFWLKAFTHRLKNNSIKNVIWIFQTCGNGTCVKNGWNVPFSCARKSSCICNKVISFTAKFTCKS